MGKRFFLRYLFVFIVSFSFGFAWGQKYSRQDYIQKYSPIAVEEMKRSGIPASITLAQGMVESGCGNSSLAREANNHFGIKCHKWQGKKYFQDDDAPNECFRKYSNAEESYRDHTDFLMNTSRYAFLFEYKSDDYKGWAHGLKKAGYATSPSYARDLIRTIEENELHRFDKGDYTYVPSVKNKPRMAASDENFVIDIKRRKIFTNNDVQYIVAEEGDNLISLTKEMDLFSWQLVKYNDLPADYHVTSGDRLYIQPKRWKAQFGNDFHIVAENETMHSISQLYGIKLKKLYYKNRMEIGSEPKIGQKIWLRKRMPKEVLQN
ncbi:MAG TPA: glucosaminidase domain-containing protein [Bacteroidales bacterium]|nr:glucosaminidase domain-containing protein [Bacteroidales bacterium]